MSEGNKKITYSTAILFGIIHLLIVVRKLLESGGIGEGQGMTVLVFDFPLVALLSIIPGGAHILYGSIDWYIWFFAIVGTAMYVVFGTLLGLLIGRFRRPRKESERTV